MALELPGMFWPLRGRPIVRIGADYNLPGGCVKCPLNALNEGQLSAQASLAKTFANSLLVFHQYLFIILIWRV